MLYLVPPAMHGIRTALARSTKEMIPILMLVVEEQIRRGPSAIVMDPKFSAPLLSRETVPQLFPEEMNMAALTWN